MAVNEALWQAIVNCETTFDGQYIYGVKSTGIFCRPSCRSRTPLQENVHVFQSAKEAREAGFRPCKRCRPDKYSLAPDEELIQSAKRLMERRFQDRVTLNTLARELAVSPYHLHRVFKRLTGITPADYVLRKRIRAAKDALSTEPYRTVTDIAIATGFQSAAYFSTVFQKETGCTPRDYRVFHLQNQTPERAVR